MSTGSPEEQRAMLELFEAALEQPEAGRAAFIAANAATDTIRVGALDLLASHDAAQAALRTGLPGAQGMLDEDDYAPPLRLGQYRIVSAIGRGGMGVVYLGERDAGDFERTVAIKVIRPGLLSDSLIERFARERQILATLDHPHIARMYDGGQTDDGAPYIVMEYVEGVSLARWLEETAPTLDQRLGLLLDVCEAVEFAHQNLVVHRDLTPGNVIVTPTGQPKLIDFGIARPQHADDAAAAPQSSLSGLSLTPGFAAPERTAGAPVTTLSDIYSLGKIMGIMIAPFAEQELSAIAAKAAADAPEDRFAGAALLAQEIRDFRAGRAVASFSAAPGYRVRKFVRRNRVPVALAGLVAVLLTGSLVAVTSAWREEARARANAEQRFAEVRELSNFLLFDLYDELEDVPGATRALNDIADRARHYLDVLSQTEGADTALRLEAALAYKRLSDVLGTPIAANLGRREEAGETLALAIAQLRNLAGEAPGDTAVQRGLAEALYSQAVFAFIALDDNELAHRAAREAAALYWQLAQTGGEEEFAPLAIDAEIEAAIPLAWVGRGEEGAARLRETHRRIEAHLAKYGSSASNLGLLARTRSNLSETLSRTVDAAGGAAEDYAESLRYANEAIAAYRRYVAASDPADGPRRSMAIALFKRSLILYTIDDLDPALVDLNEAEGILTRLAVRDPDDAELDRNLAAIREQKAITLAYAGQRESALALAAQSTAAKRAMLAGEPDNPGRMRDLASNLLLGGEVAQIVDAPEQACAFYREGQTLYRRIEAAYGLSDYDRDQVIGDLEQAIGSTC